MLRFLGEAVSLIFFLLVIRSAISAVWRMLQSGGSVPNPAYRPSHSPEAAPVRSSGELRKDPVCGTFVATTSAWTKGAGAETVFFCSQECRDKYKSGRAQQTEWGKRTATRG